MKKNILLPFLFLSLLAFSQKVSNIDFDQIKEHVEDSSSEFYYSALRERLLNLDTTLTYTHYKHLYYGNVFTNTYSPYGKSDNDKEFTEEYNNGNFDDAKVLGKKILEENPIDLRKIYQMMICHHNLQEIDTAKLYARQYYSFLNVIYNSGTGKDVKDAYVVIKVNDEYQIVNDLGLTSTGQALLSDGPTDKLTISTKGQKKVKGQKKIKALYFNVSKLFEHQMKLFK